MLGRRAVLEALRAGRPIGRVVRVADAHPGGLLGEIDRAARAHGIPVDLVDRRQLDALAGGVPHQGVAAFGAGAREVDLDAVLRTARSRGEAPLLVVLDGVEDPHNLGAVIRTAEAAGAHGVVIPKRRAVGLGPTVARAAAGATAHLAVAAVINLAAALERLKTEGVWIVGADASAREAYDAGALAPPVALVLGGEGRGLHRLVRERCDHLIRIPMWGHVESLNVSVAAGLLLYEAARRRELARAQHGVATDAARKASIDLA